jgi:hypothetical protein
VCIGFFQGHGGRIISNVRQGWSIDRQSVVWVHDRFELCGAGCHICGYVVWSV